MGPSQRETSLGQFGGLLKAMQKRLRTFVINLAAGKERQTFLGLSYLRLQAAEVFFASCHANDLRARSGDNAKVFDPVGAGFSCLNSPSSASSPSRASRSNACRTRA